MDAAGQASSPNPRPANISIPRAQTALRCYLASARTSPCPGGCSSTFLQPRAMTASVNQLRFLRQYAISLEASRFPVLGTRSPNSRCYVHSHDPPAGLPSSCLAWYKAPHTITRALPHAPRGSQTTGWLAVACSHPAAAPHLQNCIRTGVGRCALEGGRVTGF